MYISYSLEWFMKSETEHHVNPTLTKESSFASINPQTQRVLIVISQGEDGPHVLCLRTHHVQTYRHEILAQAIKCHLTMQY